MTPDRIRESLRPDLRPLTTVVSALLRRLEAEDRLQPELFGTDLSLQG